MTDLQRIEGEWVIGKRVVLQDGAPFILPAATLYDSTGLAVGTSGNPLFVNNAGGGAIDVSIPDGADEAEGSTGDVAYTDATGAANGTLIGLAKGRYVAAKATGANAQNVQGAQANAAATTVNPVLIAGNDGTNTRTLKTDTSGNQIVVGNVANNAVDSGNSVKIGGVYNTTISTLTSGNRGDAQLDQRSNMRARLVAGVFTGIDGQVNTALGAGLASDSNAVNPLLMVTAGFVFNGTSWDRQRGDANAVAMQPALTTSFWNYAAAASGILNTTTAVTMKTAAGGVIRNYIEALQLDWEAFGAASEVVIRDGAGGTVLYRMKIGTGTAGSRVITFRPALKGTANTLLEIATLTASVTGALYVNAQGWVGV